MKSLLVLFLATLASSQAKEKLIFKSVRPVPGHEFIRIYDGKMAVVNFLANIQLVVDGQDVKWSGTKLKITPATSFTSEL